MARHVTLLEMASGMIALARSEEVLSVENQVAAAFTSLALIIFGGLGTMRYLQRKNTRDEQSQSRGTPLPETLLALSPDGAPRAPYNYRNSGRIGFIGTGGAGGAMVVATIEQLALAERLDAAGLYAVFESSQKARERVLAQLSRFPQAAARLEINAALSSGNRGESVQTMREPRRQMQYLPELERFVESAVKLARGTEKDCLDPAVLTHPHILDTLICYQASGGSLHQSNLLTKQIGNAFGDADIISTFIIPANPVLRRNFPDGITELFHLDRVRLVTVMDERRASKEDCVKAMATGVAVLINNVEDEDIQNIIRWPSPARNGIVVPHLVTLPIPVKAECGGTRLLTWRESVIDALQVGFPRVLARESALLDIATCHRQTQRVVLVQLPLSDPSFDAIRGAGMRMFRASGLLDSGTSVFWARRALSAVETARGEADVVFVVLEAAAGGLADVLAITHEERRGGQCHAR